MTEWKSPGEVQSDVAVIRDWMSKQPHLPQDIEDKILRRFLHSCYYSLEKTKRCIDLFFTLRAASPEMLNNRDPLSQEMQKVFQITDLGYVRLKDNSNLFLWRLNDMDSYDYLSDAKLAFMDADVFLLEDDPLAPRDLVIIDVKEVTLKFLTKFNVSAAKKLGQFQQEAMPVRLKQIHVVNSPSYIDTLYGLMKPFIKPDICEMIHFHTPNSDTLYKYINREELPSDYGGEADSMANMMKARVQKIVKHRDFFLNENLWKADESKRPKDNKYALKGLQNGSFRKLDID